MNKALIYDSKTPLPELIKILSQAPLTLTATDAKHLCGEGKLFELWPSDSGYTIGVINLHAYIRDNNLPNTNVILRIPQTVDGIPVTRIASGAFMKWLSYDTLVHLLDCPEGMESIAKDCLSPLSVENIYLPSTLTQLEPQVLSVGTHAQIQRTVRFFAHPDNPIFSTHEGSLYTKDFTTLHYAAFPYKDTVRLHENTRHITENAFVQSDLMPHFISCPPYLEDTKDFVSKDTIWLRDEDSTFAAFIDGRNMYGACHTFFEEDGDFFDIINKNEARLIRSFSHEDELRLPAQVHGCTLKHIGPYALPKRVKRLDIPVTINTIAHDNACPALQRLILHDGITSIGERCFTSRMIENAIFLPQSLKRVGNASFPRCTCRICAENCDVTIPDYEHTHLFGRTDMLFDFDRYDLQLTSIRAPKTRVDAILDRLNSVHPVSEEVMPEIIKSLRQTKKLVMQQVAHKATVSLIAILINHEFYQDDMADDQITLLQEMHKPDCVARMIQYKHQKQAATPKARPSSRFAF